MALQVRHRGNQNAFDVIGSSGQKLFSGEGPYERYVQQRWNLTPSQFLGLSDEDFLRLLNGASSSSASNAEQFVQNQMRRQFGLN